MPFKDSLGRAVEKGRIVEDTRSVVVGTVGTGAETTTIDMTGLVNIEDADAVLIEGEGVDESQNIAAEVTSTSDNTATVTFYTGTSDGVIQSLSNSTISDISDVTIEVTAEGV